MIPVPNRRSSITSFSSIWVEGFAGSSPPAWLAISKPMTCPCKASIKNWTWQSLIMCHNWVSWPDADPAQSSDLGKYRVLSEHGAQNQFTLKINLPFQPKWKTENILFMIVLLDFIVRTHNAWNWTELKSLSHVWPFATPTRLLPPWDSPGKYTGVGCHFLLQGIFLTQGSNPGLLHCRQTL